MVCPVCFNAKQLDKGDLLPSAELAGSVQPREWIGGDGATIFSYRDRVSSEVAGFYRVSTLTCSMAV
jgi:hypothetical protein